MSSERFSLKDHLFNQESVTYLADLFADSDPRFRRKTFTDEVMSKLPDLELKQRISMIADVLADHLPADYEDSATQILKALPPPLDPTLTDDDFGDFIIAPLGEYVATRGLGERDFETSMRLIHELTKRFSMEGPIRPFLSQYPDRTLERLGVWVIDDNYHVRRLVSEGTRPTLPWASRIGIDIERPLPLLGQLHADPTRYVTRSVANHMNDISKLRPELVFSTLERWRGQNLQETNELDWMTRHSLRTLVKKGEPKAMELLGFSPDAEIDVSPIELNSKAIHFGDELRFSATVKAEQDARLLIDYEIDFVKKNGTTRPKVFKLRHLELGKGESARLEKRHRFRKDASTFTLYPGTHRVSLKVNGRLFPGAEFDLAP